MTVLLQLAGVLALPGLLVGLIFLSRRRAEGARLQDQAVLAATRVQRALMAA